jgi:hypothetical protein
MSNEKFRKAGARFYIMSLLQAVYLEYIFSSVCDFYVYAEHNETKYFF